MKPYLHRSGLAIIISIITICLFFNAKNLGNNYYYSATAISQARADYGDMVGLLDQLDYAVMDFSRGGVVKDATREIGKGAGGLLDGLGKFLSSLADETSSPALSQSVDPEVDETVKKMKEVEAERLKKDEERAEKNKEAIKVFREKIEARQDAAKKIKSDIPSAFWQWMLFMLSLFATIVAWYEAFFPGHIVPVQTQPQPDDPYNPSWI